MLSKASTIDAVVVAVPNRYHRDVALAVAQAGKHMLLEKPVSHNYATAREVLDACSTKGQIVRVGHNERCQDASILARELVQSNVIGEVLSFRNVFSHSWRVVSIDDYRWNLEISGGATMMDITSHSVDLVRYLIGGEYASVASSLRHSAMPKVVDDNVHLLVETTNGASGSFASDRFSPTHHFTTELYGTEGSLHLSQLVMSGTTVAPLAVFTDRPLEKLPPVLQENARPRFAAYDNQRKTDGWYLLYPPRRSSYVNQMRAFAQLLRGETPDITLCTLEDGGWATLLLCLPARNDRGLRFHNVDYANLISLSLTCIYSHLFHNLATATSALAYLRTAEGPLPRQDDTLGTCPDGCHLERVSPPPGCRSKSTGCSRTSTHLEPPGSLAAPAQGGPQFGRPTPVPIFVNHVATIDVGKHDLSAGCRQGCRPLA